MKRSGFTLLEVLVAVALLGILLGAFAQFQNRVRLLQEEETNRQTLSDHLSLLASVLGRESYLVGYGVDRSSALVVDLDEELLIGSFLCEPEMKDYCFAEGPYRFAYKWNGRRVLWGYCHGTESCFPNPTEVVLGGEGRVEVVRYRLAYESGGIWRRANLSELPPSGVTSLAFYLLARTPSFRQNRFSPGSQVDWPSGLTLRSLGLSEESLEGNWYWGERLVVVQTPNLGR